MQTVASNLRAACFVMTVLAGCAQQPEPPAAAPPPRAVDRILQIATDQGPIELALTRYSSLRGWEAEDHAAALGAFLDGCGRIEALPETDSMGGVAVNGAPLGGRVSEWRRLCQSARTTPSDQARAWFEAMFLPVLARKGPEDAALFTGYFEPELDASRIFGAPYVHPIYAKPDDLVSGEPYFTRAEINAGALAGRELELFWADDPTALFFLHVQGSGRLRLTDGSTTRIGYAGKNGRPYASIGRALVERGAFTLEESSADRIKAWLAENPNEAQALLEENQSYIFFTERPEADSAPVGSFGSPLSPLRSMAVDKAVYPLGAPMWVETDAPAGGPLRRLMMAVDAGSAIKGPQRGDLFFGFGDAAGDQAGAMKQWGAMILLLPREGVARRLLGGDE